MAGHLWLPSPWTVRQWHHWIWVMCRLRMPSLCIVVVSLPLFTVLTVSMNWLH